MDLRHRFGGVPPPALPLWLLLALHGPWCVAAQCPATILSFTVGMQTTPVSVPALAEGRSYKRECSWVSPGYDGFVEVLCVGSRLSGSTDRCVAKGCVAKQEVDVQVGNDTMQVSITGALRHGAVTSAPCSRLVAGYEGHIWLQCSLGALRSDGSSCRPPPLGERSFWRLVHEGFLPGTWRIFEASFYATAKCTGKLQGFPATSSQDDALTSAKAFAFDGDAATSWAARCEGGCLPGVAWLGLLLPKGAADVRCVELYQSRVACCSSRNVRLETWDGAEWQTISTWDTTQIVPSAGYTQRLVVPNSCDRGFPEGIGVTHDCVGRPISGLQRGDICHASCEEGYFGSRTQFRCGSDGTMEGRTPTCYDTKVIFLGSYIGSTVIALLAFAHQYRFWLMRRHHKMRLADDPDLVLPVMVGRWHEKDGMGLWESILAAENEEDKTIDESVDGGDSERSPYASNASEASKQKTKKKGKGDPSPRKAVKEGSPRGASPRGKAVSPRGKDASPRGGGSSPRSPKGKDVGSPRSPRKNKKKNESGGKGNLKHDLDNLRKNLVTEKGFNEEFLGDSMESKHELKESRGLTGRGRVFLDGLCSPCEDADICMATMCCPLCRIADTWHTIGDPGWMGYWTILFTYVLMPCMWPCLNFYGRQRIRRYFEIPPEPHRDLCIHCCCCCCCTPFGLCQEARAVDAPVHFARMKQHLSFLKDEGLRA